MLLFKPQLVCFRSHERIPSLLSWDACCTLSNIQFHFFLALLAPLGFVLGCVFALVMLNLTVERIGFEASFGQQSRVHSSPECLIIFADYSAQAVMEFFVPSSPWAGKTGTLFFACLDAEVVPWSSLTMLLGSDVSLIPRPLHDILVGFGVSDFW